MELKQKFFCGKNECHFKVVQFAILLSTIPPIDLSRIPTIDSGYILTEETTIFCVIVYINASKDKTVSKMHISHGFYSTLATCDSKYFNQNITWSQLSRLRRQLFAKGSPLHLADAFFLIPGQNYMLVFIVRLLVKECTLS